MENEMIRPQVEEESLSEAILKTVEEPAEETKQPEEPEQPKLPKLYLRRRKYPSKDGREFWEYILPVVFCGARMEARLVAADVSGYEALDKVFESGGKVEFCVTESKMVNETTKEVRKYYTYEAVISDETGFAWRFPLKLKSTSDKAFIENYMRYLKNLMSQDKK